MFPGVILFCGANRIFTGSSIESLCAGRETQRGKRELCVGGLAVSLLNQRLSTKCCQIVNYGSQSVGSVNVVSSRPQGSFCPTTSVQLATDYFLQFTARPHLIKFPCSLIKGRCGGWSLKVRLK